MSEAKANLYDVVRICGGQDPVVGIVKKVKITVLEEWYKVLGDDGMEYILYPEEFAVIAKLDDVYANAKQLAAAYGCDLDGVKRIFYNEYGSGPWVDFSPQGNLMVVGSIVEGSDAEIGPYTIPFPATSGQIHAVLEKVNAEATEAWYKARIDELEERERKAAEAINEVNNRLKVLLREAWSR